MIATEERGVLTGVEAIGVVTPISVAICTIEVGEVMPDLSMQAVRACTLAGSPAEQGVRILRTFSQSMEGITPGTYSFLFLFLFCFFFWHTNGVFLDALMEWIMIQGLTTQLLIPNRRSKCPKWEIYSLRLTLSCTIRPPCGILKFHLIAWSVLVPRKQFAIQELSHLLRKVASWSGCFANFFLSPSNLFKSEVGLKCWTAHSVSCG